MDSGNYIFTFKDITESARDEEILRRTKLRTDMAMQAADIVIWEFDAIRDLYFLENSSLNGYDRRQTLSSKDYINYLHDDDRPLQQDVTERMILGEDFTFSINVRILYPGTDEWQYCTINGATYEKDERGRVIRYVGTRKNYTELARLLRHNDIILDHTNSGLAYISKDFIVEWENISRCAPHISFEAYKVGEPCYQSAHNRTSPCPDCVMQRALNSRKTEQIRFSFANGLTIEVFGTPVFGPTDSIEGIVIRVDDVTERERMIGKLTKAKAAAERSDKLKSAFLANISHEIRTPLNAIVGFSELLAATDDIPEREQYLQVVRKNNEELLKLIDNILDLSTIEAGYANFSYVTFDLPDCFRETIQLMQRRMTNRKLELKPVIPHASRPVKLDKNRVVQILTNYIDNAVKSTTEGSIEIGYEPTADGIRIFVQDSGTGTGDGKREDVLGRFGNDDQSDQGLGLDLAVCKAIAESMGGTVGVDSTDGKGSLYWACLPCESHPQ